MKKYIGGIITALFISALPFATQAATVEVNELTSGPVFFMDFDVLALEFDLEGAQNETLNAITVEHSGSARPNIDFKNLILWLDESEEGFQGWGFDKKLADAEEVGGVWVFNDLNEFITSSDQRFFVSLESGTFIQNKNSQFLLSQQNDTNSNGIWEEGERGIFLQGGDAVSNLEERYSSKVISFKDTKADVMPPKGYITNFDAPPAVTELYVLSGGEITFNGVAKDRGGNVVSSVVVSVNGTNVVGQSVNGQYDDWTAKYTPTEDLENLAIALKITDSLGQTWTSPVYSLKLDIREADPLQTFFSRSKTIIKPDGEDTAILTVTVKDDKGDILPNRTVQFLTPREEDVLETSSVVTDSEGRVSVQLTSTKEGNASVQAMIDSTQIALTTVLVQGEGEADETPNPVELPAGLETGDLIKASLDAVYYLDSNGKRHVFVTDKIYFSWYGNDFSSVKTISDTVLASIPLGDPVSYRPGTLLTAPSINEVYVVDVNRTLRHIGSEQVAKELFGDTWNKQIHDLAESLLFAYNFGDVVNDVTDVNISELESLSVTINSEIIS
jgi:hypothetical protein